MNNILPPQLELESEINTDTRVEVIVRYNGDISRLAEELGIGVEILSEDYAIITLEPYKLTQLASLSQIEYIEKPKVLTYMLDNSLRASCIYGNESYNTTALRGEGVLIGIIDSGIDYTHPDFIDNEGKSRIAYIWDQSVSGTPPAGFNEGSEYSNEDINRALEGDSLEHYDLSGHGTHVAGIAAGNGRASGGRYVGVASEAELIVVKLGETGREFFARTTELMRAIKYILDKAVELNKPVVINISYGTNDGSHDGESLFETYINEMSAYWKNSIVVAMGNEGAQAHHYQGRVKNGSTVEVEFNIVGNISTMFLTIWKSFIDVFEFELIAPNGQSSGVIRTGRYRLEDTNVYTVIGQPTPYNDEQEIYIRMVGEGGRVNNGVWILRVTGVNVVEGGFDIWLPVTEAVGIRTAFLEPDRNITLTLPASAQRVISVGGYNSDNNSLASFSGRGYTRNTDFIKPDLVAPAVNITSTIPGGGYDSLSGTSMAAPHVAGAAAILMQWGIVEGNDPFMYGERLKSYLRLGANRSDNIDYPNREWGFGRLCLGNTLNILEQSDISVSIQQSQSLEDVIYSNEYRDYIIEYSPVVVDILQRENIFYCNVRMGEYLIVFMNSQEASRILSYTEVAVVASTPLAFGLMQASPLEASGITQIQNRPFLNLRGNGVLVAIIDTGIDYKDPEFIYEDGSSRIVSIWDQTIRGNPPEGTCFGYEFTNESINTALSTGEDLPTTDTINHGTRIAKIAAGRSGAAPDSELVVVKVKGAKEYIREEYLIPDGVPAYEESDLIQAIRYVTSVAERLQKSISICFSMGTNGGGHDGGSIIERYLNNVGTRNGVAVSVPMGNEGTARHHTFFQITSDMEYYDIEISVGENDEGFPLWIWLFNPDRASVGIITPIGERIQRVEPQFSGSNRFNFALGSGSVIVSYNFPTVGGNDNLITVKFIKPISGVWRIRVFRESITFGYINAWLPIRQFTSSDTVFLAPSANTTLTVPASGVGTIVVGGYNSYENSTFADTGRGPNRVGVLKPYIVAPAVNVEGVTGTSAASAISTGAAALMLEWGIVKGNNPIMNSVTIQAYFIRGAEQRAGDVYPNNIWGFGSLNLNNTFEDI